MRRKAANSSGDPPSKTNDSGAARPAACRVTLEGALTCLTSALKAAQAAKQLLWGTSRPKGESPRLRASRHSHRGFATSLLRRARQEQPDQRPGRGQGKRPGGASELMRRNACQQTSRRCTQGYSMPRLSLSGLAHICPVTEACVPRGACSVEVQNLLSDAATHYPISRRGSHVPL